MATVNTLELIKELDPEIVDCSGLFCFESENSFVDLKVMSHEIGKFQSYSIELNKIEFAENNPDKDFYFVFKFSDGVFYTKFNKLVYSKFKKQKRNLAVVFVPIGYLIRIYKRELNGFVLHF